MPSFTIDDFRYDVLDYAEEDHGQNGIIRRFVVEAFYLGQPFDWHPNQPKAHDFPGAPHRQQFTWSGFKTVDVYKNVGTRQKPEWVFVETVPGGDFRGDFFQTLVYHSQKCLIAMQQGKTKSEVTKEELGNVSKPDPVNLKSKTLSEAVLTTSGKVVQPSP